jgi:hypothetical protein
MQIVVAKSATDPRWLSRYRPARLARKPIAKMSTADAAELDRLLRSADQLSAKVRQAFIDAVNNLGDQIDVDQIKQLLQQGRVDQAIRTVDAQLTARGFAPVADAITGAAIDAARQSARAVNALGQMNVSFGLTNPQTVDFLRQYEMGLIRAMSQDALASVRTAIQAGVAAGRSPLDVARDVRQFIGLTDSQTQAVQNYRRALENGSRDALQRALRDKRFDPSVLRSIQNDTALSGEKIDTMVDRYAARYLRYRSETIARTESIRALGAGNHQLWNQTVASGKVDADQVTKKWATVGDHKVRDTHRELDGQVVGLNQQFQCSGGPIMYPGDPNADAAMTVNCRCAVIYRFKLKPTP